MAGHRVVFALYFGPVAVWAYRRFGQPSSSRWLQEHGMSQPPDRPGWASTAVGVSHCGAGCTLGDTLAEFTVFGLAAISLGIVFQYLAMAPMRGLSLGKGLVEAAKAEVLSLTAFEVGLFGWMALMAFVFFPHAHPHPDSPVYWFLMQLGMIIGFITAWPANVWLIRRGIKEAI